MAQDKTPPATPDPNAGTDGPSQPIDAQALAKAVEDAIALRVERGDLVPKGDVDKAKAQLVKDVQDLKNKLAVKEDDRDTIPVTEHEEALDSLRSELTEQNAKGTAALQRTIDKLRAAGNGSGPGYELRPDGPDSTVKRFDAVIAGKTEEFGWLWHEAIGFGHDSGYGKFMVGRAKESVERAFSVVRMGPELQGVGQTYDRLPAFSRELAIEVIVRIVPAQTED